MILSRKRYERELHQEFIKGYNVACAHNKVFYEGHVKPELLALKEDHWDKLRFNRLMNIMEVDNQKSPD